jgi:hypothetical protein
VKAVWLTITFPGNVASNAMPGDVSKFTLFFRIFALPAPICTASVKYSMKLCVVETYDGVLDVAGVGVVIETKLVGMTMS